MKINIDEIRERHEANASKRLSEYANLFRENHVKKWASSFITPELMKSVQQANSFKYLSTDLSAPLGVSEPAKSLSANTALRDMAAKSASLSEQIKKVTELHRLSLEKINRSMGLETYKNMAVAMVKTAHLHQQSQLDERLKSIAEGTYASSFAKKHLETLQNLTSLTGLDSFKSLVASNRSVYAWTEILQNIPEQDFPNNDLSVAEIDAQLVNEIESVDDASQLSQVTIKTLSYLFHYFFLPVFLSCLATYIMDNAFAAKQELNDVSSQSAVRKFVKKPQSSFDREALSGYRITTATRLNLRTSPGMKSEVITTLPLGTLVEVIDKSDRAWLYVEVEVDDITVKGYISRRYTTYFK